MAEAVGKGIVEAAGALRKRKGYRGSGKDSACYLGGVLLHMGYQVPRAQLPQPHLAGGPACEDEAPVVAQAEGCYTARVGVVDETMVGPCLCTVCQYPEKK